MRMHPRRHPSSPIPRPHRARRHRRVHPPTTDRSTSVSLASTRFAFARRRPRRPDPSRDGVRDDSTRGGRILSRKGTHDESRLKKYTHLSRTPMLSLARAPVHRDAPIARRGGATPRARESERDASSRRRLAMLELHRGRFVEWTPSSVTALACAPGGALVARARECGAIEVYDARDWRCVARARSRGEGRRAERVGVVRCVRGRRGGWGRGRGWGGKKARRRRGRRRRRRAR